MKNVGLLFFLLSAYVFLTSCFLFKSIDSDTLILQSDCQGSICSTAAKSIQCNPQINSSQMTYTYIPGNSILPTISSACSEKKLDYTWTVKKSDASIVTSSIAGLNGEFPSNLDFRILGPGAYYVFLTATSVDGDMVEFQSRTPLEFVVPGPNIGSSLTCDPKLNTNLATVNVGPSDANPSIISACVPLAANHIWRVTKDEKDIFLAGLSGSSSSPNFKALGDGVYKVYLYTTGIGSTHWRSANPLIVNVKEVGKELVEESVQCNPKLNGSLMYYNFTSASAPVQVSANCLQQELSYNWSVYKNGSAIVAKDFTGAHSNIDFSSYGKGVYQIYLNATSKKIKSWNSSVPLTIIVGDSVESAALNCAPRLNKEFISLNLEKGSKNPSITANCKGAGIKYSWTVYKDRKKIEVLNLAGATSTPALTESEGLYSIYLTATADNKNAYQSVTPLVLSVGSEAQAYREVQYEKTVPESDNKVDLLLVVDDSKSMLQDNAKLAQKLESFVKDLTSAGFDWQMCATVTRWQDDNPDKKAFWGLSRKWSNHIGNPPWVVNAGANNLSPIFNDTIQAIGAGWENTDDERGIKAAWHHLDNAKFNSCYRENSTLAVILVSDEDVRSIGGNASFIYYENELKFLESEDLPQSYILKVKKDLNYDKRFTFNSIIVKPEDSACMSQQDANENSKSHYGYKYAELSNLTNGTTASICDLDYTQTLTKIKSSITNSINSIPLECAPSGSIKIELNPKSAVKNISLKNNKITLSPKPAPKTKIKISYNCPTN